MVLALASLLLCCSVAAEAAKVCVLPVAISPQKTNLTVSGTVVAPLPGDIMPKGPASLQGYVYLVFPEYPGAAAVPFTPV